MTNDVPSAQGPSNEADPTPRLGSALSEALRAIDSAMAGPREERRKSFYDDLIQNIGKTPVIVPGGDAFEASMRRKAEKERSEAERRVDDSKNFELMAGILEQMNRDREVNLESRKKQATFNTIMAIVSGVLALGGLVVPFVVEAIKGWK